MREAEHPLKNIAKERVRLEVVKKPVEKKSEDGWGEEGG